LYVRGQTPGSGWESWRSPTWTNTIRFPGGIHDGAITEARDNLSDEFFRQEYGAEFTALTGRVYKEFQRETHVIDALPEGAVPRYRSIDFGYTNPFVCLWIAEDNDGRWYVYDEHYQTQTTLGEHAKAIKERGGEYTLTVSDPAGAQEAAELTEHGVWSQPAKTAKKAGRELVRQRLKIQGDSKPRLFVLRRCEHTIYEFENYRMPEQRGDQSAPEEPLKKDDHAMDCLKNLAVTRQGQGGWGQIR
jgi:phage terminase large subunit